MFSEDTTFYSDTFCTAPLPKRIGIRGQRVDSSAAVLLGEGMDSLHLLLEEPVIASGTDVVIPAYLISAHLWREAACAVRVRCNTDKRIAPLVACSRLVFVCFRVCVFLLFFFLLGTLLEATHEDVPAF